MNPLMTSININKIEFVQLLMDYVDKNSIILEVNEKEKKMDTTHL